LLQIPVLRTLIAILILLHLSLFSFGQDSCMLRITLLTCSPGNELYSTFGHTAIRVQDAGTGTDVVYNYGTFEFSPDFYVKFVRGKLLYALAVESFHDFSYAYQYESRSVVEQEILLGCTQKQALLASLRLNALEQNRYYRYDFLLDNCTTRAGDMIALQAEGPVQYRKIIPAEAPTFRNLLHVYLDKGLQFWSKLGIDLLLGSRIDRRVTNKEAMFLPDNLMKAMDGATAGERLLVTPPRPVLTLPSPLGQASLLTPGVVLTLTCLLLAFVTQQRNRWQKIQRVIDFLLFFTSGLIGVLLLFMWFGTDHYWCGNNFNLVWAIPLNLPAAFVLFGQKGWAAKYLKLLSWWMLAVVLLWFFLPQQMNNAFLPIVLLLLLRTWHLSKSSSYAGKRDQTQ
jgi:hypothetical protein